MKSALSLHSDLESNFDFVNIAYENVKNCSALVGIQSSVVPLTKVKKISLIVYLDQIHNHVELKRILQQIDTPLQRLSEDLKQVTDNLESE
jgi:hypothetical protein